MLTRHSLHPLRSLFKSEFLHFELSHIIRGIGASLISVFIPVFLLESGFSVQEVLIFYIAQYTITMFSIPLTVFLHKTIGIKHTMSLSKLFLGLYLLAFQYISDMRSLVAVAFLHGISITLYWFGFFILFNQTSKGKEVEHVSIHAMVTKTVHTLTPLFTGLVIGLLNPTVLVVLSMVCLIVSTYLFTNKTKMSEPTLPTWRIIINELKQRMITTSFLGFNVYGMEFIALTVLWPLYLYLQTESLITTGAIFLAASILSYIAMFVVGKYPRTSTYLQLGTVLNSLSWIGKGLASGAVFLMSTEVFHEISRSLFSTSFNGKVHQIAAKDSDKYSYFLLHEFGMNIGKILLLTLAILLPELNYTFFIVAAFGWVYFLI